MPALVAGVITAEQTHVELVHWFDDDEFIDAMFSYAPQVAATLQPDDPLPDCLAPFAERFYQLRNSKQIDIVLDFFTTPIVEDTTSHKRSEQNEDDDNSSTHERSSEDEAKYEE